MTQKQARMWAEIKDAANDGAMVEMTLKSKKGENAEQDEVVHGRLEFVPQDVEAKGAKLVLFTKDYPGGIEHNCAIECDRVVRSVRQHTEAGEQGV